MRSFLAIGLSFLVGCAVVLVWSGLRREAAGARHEARTQERLQEVAKELFDLREIIKFEHQSVTRQIEHVRSRLHDSQAQHGLEAMQIAAGQIADKASDEEDEAYREIFSNLGSGGEWDLPVVLSNSVVNPHDEQFAPEQAGEAERVLRALADEISARREEYHAALDDCLVKRMFRGAFIELGSGEAAYTPPSGLVANVVVNRRAFAFPTEEYPDLVDALFELTETRQQAAAYLTSVTQRWREERGTKRDESRQ